MKYIGSGTLRVEQKHHPFLTQDGMLGKRINTIDALLRRNGKAVWVEKWNRTCPVAFLVSMRVQPLVWVLRDGIYELRRKSK